jgi:hypothetical protein
VTPPVRRPSTHPRLIIDRRTFLKAAGLAGVGVAGAHAALGGSRPPAPRPAVADQVDQDPIAAQADALGYDQDAIFRFVADEIAYEPYGGVLRGAAATLAGRAGNAADKAVLLAALLQESFIETRFVSGTLDDVTASTLGATTVDAAAARARAEAILTDSSSSGATPAPAAGAQPIIDRLPEIEASVDAWASAAIDGSVRIITDALAGAGITLPAAAASLPELERTRHLWVQAPFGTEWLDLDATLPDSQTGQVIAAPSGEPFATIPDDLRHRIDLTVTAEQLAGTSLVQEALIEHTLFADELPDTPLALGHAKPEGFGKVGIAIEQFVTGGVRYQPVLQVGPTAIVGVTGLLIAGDGSGMFDTGGAGAGDGEATAEWLDVAITAPGGRVTTARRTVFDRVGDETRSVGTVDPAAIPAAELVDLSPDQQAEYLPLKALRFLSVATGASGRPKMAATEGQEAEGLAFPVRMYHLTRDATNATMSLDRGVAVHLDTPNIVMHTYQLAPAGAGGVTSTETLDLLHRGFATLPVAGTTAAAPAGVLAGVTSHVAERLRGGEGLPADLAVPAPVVSVGALLERAAADGVGVRVLQGSVPADLGYPPAAAARLADALAAGWVAIGPEQPVSMGDDARLGWWLVDPATGATADMLDDGGGATMVDYAIAFFAALDMALVWIMLGQCIMGTASSITGFINANPGSTVGDVPIKHFACG